jgi:hypothetical protein
VERCRLKTACETARHWPTIRVVAGVGDKLIVEGELCLRTIECSRNRLRLAREGGYEANPRGLVWLFKEFQNADPKQIPQLLSDHPANGTRIKTLHQHFRDNPSVFSKFDSRPDAVCGA